jgi:hypothetical protein
MECISGVAVPPASGSAPALLRVVFGAVCPVPPPLSKVGNGQLVSLLHLGQAVLRLENVNKYTIDSEPFNTRFGVCDIVLKVLWLTSN